MLGQFSKGSFRHFLKTSQLSYFGRSFRSISTLIFSEAHTPTIAPSIFPCINAAQILKQPYDIWLSGEYSKEVSEQLKTYPAIGKIYIANGEATKHSAADVLSDKITTLIKEKGYSILLGAISSSVKDIFPRCAATLDVQPISEIISIQDNSTYVRSSYAGNAISTVKSSDPIKIISIRSTAFPSEIQESSENTAEIQDLGSIALKDITWIEDFKTELETVQLESAKIVVSGGRGLKNGENFSKLLEPLCQKLNSALGASRAAVDSGFAANDLQIGQSGKIVAPDLYIAVGISGAIQHVAGMKDSKVIVAINKDPEAPIFEIADYGLVADLFQSIPELTEKIQPNK